MCTTKYLFIFICVPKLPILPISILLSAELLGFRVGEFVSHRLVVIPSLMAFMIQNGVARNDIEEAVGHILDDYEMQMAEEGLLGGPHQGTA